MSAILSSSIWNKYEIITLNIARQSRFEEVAKLTRYNVYQSIKQLIKLIEVCIQKRPDAVYLVVNSYWAFLKTIFFIIIARFFDTKVIFHLHGGAFDKWYSKRSKILKKFIRFFMSQGSCIIVLSEFWKNFLSQIGLPEDKVFVVNNPVGRLFWNYRLNRNLSIHKKGKTPLNFVFTGLICKRKGLLELMDAISIVVKKSRDVYFKFIGRKHTREAKNIIEQYKKNGLLEHCCFLGEKSGEALIEEMARGDVFILPSYVENYPVAIVEAVVVGLPIISTTVGGIPEIVEDGVNGFLVSPGDTTKLAEKMLYLAENENVRKEMISENHKLADKFSPEIAARKIEDIVQKTLK